MTQPRYLSVSQLNSYIHDQFEADDNLNSVVYLTGEVSNFRKRPRHQYFKLKDDHSVISAVMFERAFSQINFDLEEGMKVLAIGRVSTYLVSGQYQFYIEHLEPDGIGQLFQAYNQLKKRLNFEGLFNQDHKKSLVTIPRKIGVVTSPSGAVIRDIVKTVHLRYPLAQVVLYPAVVQGTKAAPDILRQLKRLENRNDIDTIIIGRGGGSIEDLNAFNDEALAREIYQSAIPIISSVGHQTDFTIADYVADIRAATPTAAAEFAVPDQKSLLENVDRQLTLLMSYFNQKIQTYGAQLNQLSHDRVFEHPDQLYQSRIQELDQFNVHLKHNYRDFLYRNQRQYEQLYYALMSHKPTQILDNRRRQVDQISDRLLSSIRKYLEDKQSRYHYLKTSLKQLNPSLIMSNGYAYVTSHGQGISDVDQLDLDDEMQLHFKNGFVKVKVVSIRKDDK